MKYGLLIAALAGSSYASAVPGSVLFKRQNTLTVDPVKDSNTCGVQKLGTYVCPTAAEFRCCSEFGFCGSTDRHCGEGCQSEFGKCGITPPVAKHYNRKLLGSVPYGIMINSCKKKNTIAFGISNGPYKYTQKLLDILSAKNVKVTFFLDSNNYGPINTPENTATVKRMIAENHQVASQGDSHRDFNTLSLAQKQNELSKFEIAIHSIIGNRIPTYFRPPYLSCNDECLSVSKSMGYHVVGSNHNPNDSSNQQNITISENYFTTEFRKAKAAGDGRSFISIMEDVYEVTVNELIPFAIKESRKYGYKIVPVGECLGDSPHNWYRHYVKDDGKPVAQA